MKRLISITALLVLSISILQAQNRYDALRYSIYEREGSARTLSMGNAFTSLGGDMGAVSINPASLGLYKYSEISITPSLNIFLNSHDNESGLFKFSQVKPGLSNVGYLYSSKPGRGRTLNIGIVSNVLRSYKTQYSAYGGTDKSSWLGALASSTSALDVHANRMTVRQGYSPYQELNNVPWRAIMGWNALLLDTLPDTGFEYVGATENIDNKSHDIYIPDMLDQSYNRTTTGCLNEFAINVSGSFSDNLFFGANLGIQSLYFTDTKIYGESSHNPNKFDTQFVRFQHSYTLNTVGIGVNLQVGFIYLPISGLRLGASISTPTWMNLNDKWEESISATFLNNKNNNTQNSPLGEYDYVVITPWRWNMGASYVFPRRGMISIDYEGVSYGSISMKDEEAGLNSFGEENKRIGEEFLTTHNFRIGGEVKLLPELAIRAGYAYTQTPIKEISDDNLIAQGEALRTLNDRHTIKGYNYISGGLGYASNSRIFVDLGLQYRIEDKNAEQHYLYDDFVKGNNPSFLARPSNWKVLLTLGFRF